MVKIERSYPAPASLAEKVIYNGDDVVKQLKRDANDKCYICELKELQDPIVEHLLPHKNGRYPEREFDWDNLFWSCGHCNIVKNKRKYDSGIIDCCKQDPEELLSFYLKDGTVDVRAIDKTNKKAILTAALILEVFNSKNTGMRIEASKMRLKKLLEEMNKLYNALEKLRENPSSKVTLRQLESTLSRKSAFAAFKRNYIREHQDKYPQLMTYLTHCSD